MVKWAIKLLDIAKVKLKAIPRNIANRSIFLCFIVDV